MELLERYLQAIRFWLPRAQEEDIASELCDQHRRGKSVSIRRDGVRSGDWAGRCRTSDPAQTQRWADAIAKRRRQRLTRRLSLSDSCRRVL